MSADRIDVLAFFDGFIENAELFGTTHDVPGEMPGVTTAKKARAAVAEMIEALRNSPCYCEDGEGGERDIVCDRCAALARVGGAA